MLRVLFFGMTGAFSTPPLRAMLAAGVDVAAVVLPARLPGAGPLPRLVELPRPAPSDLPLLNPYLEPNVVHLAGENEVPVWEVGRLSDPATLDVLAARQPDLAVIACFPRLFPAELRELPRYGCLNLHPSLLPAYRGPAPLFWQARQGERKSGISLHLLDEGPDTGDIIAQAAVDWPEGAPGSEIEQRCAAEGARLLLSTLKRLDEGETLPRQRQPQAGASYFPWPSASDMMVPAGWPARRAYHFLRGAAGWPLAVQLGSERYRIRVVIDYQPGQVLGEPFLTQGDEAWIQFCPGVLHCKL